MKLSWEIAEKWFEIDYESNIFFTKLDPQNIRAAWPKTICKWILFSEHRITPFFELETCGLCNRFFNKDCFGCPVKRYTGKKCCYGTPFRSRDSDYQEHELMFLLSLYEAEKQGFKWE